MSLGNSETPPSFPTLSFWEVSSLMKNAPTMRNHFKDWTAISMAFLAGMVVAEVATELHEPSTGEIPLHASVQAPAETPPALALGTDAGKARLEEE